MGGGKEKLLSIGQDSSISIVEVWAGCIDGGNPAFDCGSDKLPDALKYLISESSSFEDVVIKRKFLGASANWEVD